MRSLGNNHRDFAPSRESESRGHAKTPFSVRWKTFCWNCRTASNVLKTEIRPLKAEIETLLREVVT